MMDKEEAVKTREGDQEILTPMIMKMFAYVTELIQIKEVTSYLL